MNILDIVKNFGNEDLMRKTGSRRESFAKLSGLGKDFAKIAVPFGIFAAGTKSSFAATATQTMVTPTDVLNFALVLEYLEADFYRRGIQAMNAGNISDEDRTAFELISRHEDDHVSFLEDALGSNAVPEPTFDFTAGGAFDPFNDYAQFLVLAQAFEDTGVRAYKGQAGNLMSDNTLLTYALQIHSVEARHASLVRRLRGNKGWIEGDTNDSPVPMAAQPVYAGEDNTVQGGVDLAGMFDAFGGNDAVTASYDEPLSMSEVNAIASLFIS